MSEVGTSLKAQSTQPTTTDTRRARDATERYTVAVVGDALDLVSALGQGSLTTSRAAQIAGTSRSKTYRLLMTLASRGFAIQDELRREWLPGPALLSLHVSGHSEVLRALSLPSMRSLHSQFNETVNLAEYRNGVLTYIEILESKHSFRASAQVGQRASLRSTALGKAVLAALPEHDAAALATAEKLQEVTERTIVDIDRLMLDVAAVRTRGWAVELGEDEAGVGCAGAAILARDGTPIGGLSVTAPEVRLANDRLPEIGEAIAFATTSLTRQLASISSIDLCDEAEQSQLYSIAPLADGHRPVSMDAEERPSRTR